MTDPQFERLVQRGDPELIAHALLDEAHDRIADERIDRLPEYHLAAAAIEWFYGMITNSGLQGVLCEPFGFHAPRSVLFLAECGLDECGRVLGEAVALFPKDAFESSDFDITDHKIPGLYSDLEIIAKPFWQWYNTDNQDTIRRCLHQFILTNRKRIVANA